MPESTWVHPSLWRVVVWAIILALIANCFLWSVSRDDEWFAKLISIASGAAAVLLIVCWYRLRKYLDDVLLLVFTIWVANAIEFGLSEFANTDSKIRQGGLYLSEALLALGAYVAHRTNPSE